MSNFRKTIFKLLKAYIMNETSWNEQFRDRTKKLAIAIIKAYGSWKKSDEIYIIGKQLLRSSSSIAANYRAVCKFEALERWR